MEVFKLMIDTKVSIWKRDIVCIRADSLEEATKIAFNNNGFLVDCLSTEYLVETEHPLKSNEDNPTTVEIMDLDGNILIDNNVNKK